MNFDKINNDNVCNCTKDGLVDTTSSFALKTNKETLREVDFKTYWEKGRRATECTEVCSLKGQSMSIVRNETDLNNTLEVYKKLFPISPKYKPHCSVLTLCEGSGLVKSSPSLNNPLHYDFYKSDDFTIDKIKVNKTISLSNV